MISYIKGLLTEIFEDAIVTEAGNMGYHIHVPLSVIEVLPCIGSEVKLYTYLQVREDAISLYGFLNRRDLEIFKQLIGVNGIGPKGALAILSTLRPDDLRLAIISADVKAISRAPGVGAKTAQRIILDLKDKIEPEDILVQTETLGTNIGLSIGKSGKEAIEALVALGYSNLEASKAVKQVVMTDDMAAEEVLKASLKYLSF